MENVDRQSARKRSKREGGTPVTYGLRISRNSWTRTPGAAVKLDLYGLKFFYARVLNKPWKDIPLIKPPKTSRIPISSPSSRWGNGLP
jgi:hypothetical protein